MSEVTLTAETGREQGSASSRRLREAGRIPGVVYGMGRDPIPLSVDRGEFRRAMTTEAGSNALIQLTVDGSKSESTLVKDLQRHPVRREVTHIDFIRIDPSKAMTLDVPIVVVGDTKKVTSQGGITEQRLSLLRVSVRPDNIPNQFEADISSMVIDDTFTVGDLVLPAGCTTEVDLSTAVVTAQLTRAAVVALRQGDDGDDGEGGGDAATDE